MLAEAVLKDRAVGRTVAFSIQYADRCLWTLRCLTGVWPVLVAVGQD